MKIFCAIIISNKAWREKAIELFLANNLSESVIDKHVILYNGNYRILIFNSGILFMLKLESILNDTNLHYKHVIYDMFVPGSITRKRILFHPIKKDEKCDCLLDEKYQFKTTNFFDQLPGPVDKEMKEKILFAPFTPHPDTSSWQQLLEYSFPLYSEFLLKFQYWSRFNKDLGSEANLTELVTRTEQFITTFHENPSQIVTDDILFGLHYFLLRSGAFEKQCVKNFHGILNINFTNFLENRKNLEQQKLSEEVWKKFYQNMPDSKPLEDEKAKGMFRTCCSLYEIMLAVGNDKRPFAHIFEGYKILLEKSNKNYTAVDDLVIDALYHLHVLHPSRFRNDCITLFGTVAHHVPN